MAFFTGVMLIILTFVAIPLQVWAHNDAMVHVFGFIHGWGYVVYLVTAADLGLRLRWNLLRIVLVAVAGTVPFCSFIAEHQVMKRIRVEQPGLAAPATSAG
jgi:integral membrane protein